MNLLSKHLLKRLPKRRRPYDKIKWCKGARTPVNDPGQRYLNDPNPILNGSHSWFGECPVCGRQVGCDGKLHRSVWHVPVQVHF